ncbi:MAG: DegQ family serine endoprotease [Vicinamibacterales bacterium]
MASPPSTPAPATPPAVTAPLVVPSPTSSYSPIVDKVAPAVVTIRVEKTVEAMPTSLPAPFRDFFGQDGPAPRGRADALGSGVIIRPDGLILTNHHVIDHANSIRVDTADGRSFTGTLVGSDQPSDLAVVKVTASNLPTVPFGDSEQVKVGDVVLAFGNPLGVGQTVTMGIVSAKGRATGISDGSYEDFLQTDAPINQGNSGGALVNLKGELVGINAQIVSPSGGNIGLGFAIPSSMARAVSDQLVKDKVVHRSKLGVVVQPLTPELAAGFGVPDARGAVVSDVEPGSPAAKAGLKQGDIVTALDGRPVSDSNALRNQIAGTTPGTEVTLDIRRDGKDQTVKATLVERERTEMADNEPAGGEGHDDTRLGLALTPVTPRLAEQLDLPRTADGLVVTGVDPEGRAAAAGVRSGDLIKSVNGKQVDSVAALRSALGTQHDRPTILLVTRRGVDSFVAIPRADS